MINCVTYNSISKIEKNTWNSIVPEGFIFQTYDALLFFENKGLIEYPAYYLVFKNANNEVVAHTTVYLIKTDLLIFSKGLLKKVVDKIRSIFPHFLNLNILESGCPISPGKSILMRQDIQMKDIVGQLTVALKNIAKNNATQLMLLRDFYEQDDASFTSLEEAKFTQIANLPTTELTIKWQSYDAYLNAMRSRFKAKLKRSLKIANKAQFKTIFVSDFSEIGEQLAKQWQNVNNHAKEYSREQLTPDFYKHINNGLNRKCRLLKVFKDDILVAHALVAIDGKILRWLFFGREQGDIKKNGAYFIAIEQIIKLAIEQKIDKIEMGLTSYMTKTDFGADMVPLYMYIKCRNKVLNYLVPKFYSKFNTEIKIVKRKVFNES